LAGHLAEYLAGWRVFERPHHQRIAHILGALDGDLLRAQGCLFGGGTCIALRHGEFRESVDIDFLVSDADGYRTLRELLTGPRGINAIVRSSAQPLQTQGEIRIDQYGIRMRVLMDGQAIKLEIVREARMALDGLNALNAPSAEDQICGVSTLTRLDLAASKLLANSDRHADDGVFSRDVIDLAMMHLRMHEARAALAKAEQAYGEAVLRDLAKAIDRLQTRPQWLERCMQMMGMTLPKALVWQNTRRLRKLFAIAPLTQLND
jgi:Nucleotidyl transferase AbiEii toxin, Type IV TA system